MKTIPLIVALFFANQSYALTQTECDSARAENTKLLKAIQDHECAGIPRKKRASAVGDSGNARGWLQIHREYYHDAKVESPWLPSYEAVCADERLSECCVVSYWEKYANKTKTNEQKCRVHNGGPTWNARKTATKNTARYWGSVSTLLSTR